MSKTTENTQDSVTASSIKSASAKRKSVAFWLVLFNYAQAGIGFLVSLWLARKLGSVEYGLLSYGLVVAGICKIVVGFASERTLVRDLVHSTNNNAMMTASMVLRTAMACLSIGYCLVWALVSETLGPKAIPMILCSIWGALMALTPRAWFDCEYKMHVNAAIMLIEKVVYAVSIVILVSMGFQGTGAICAASCLVITRCIGLAGEWWYTTNTFRLSIGQLRENLGFLVRQNALILGAALANLLMTHVNQIYLEKFDGLRSLAHYAIAFQIISMVSMAQSQFVRLLAPQTAELTRPERVSKSIRRILLRYIFYSGLATAIFIVPLAIACPIIIKLLLPPEYLKAVSPLRVLCMWSMLYGPALVINQFLLGLRLKRYYFVTTLISGSMAVILGQLFIPFYGGTGVAYSLLLAHATSIAIQFLGVWFTLGKIVPAEVEKKVDDVNKTGNGS